MKKIVYEFYQFLGKKYHERKCAKKSVVVIDFLMDILAPMYFWSRN